MTELPKRKPNRLKGYDYNNDGYYFITICTKNKKPILCNIVGGGAFDAPKINLTNIGLLVERNILSSNNIPQITVHKYVIMPNHIHLILHINNENGTSRAPSPTNNLVSHTVATLKRFVNKEAGFSVFQRSFYDHIIRGEKDYRKIWDYVDSNPALWQQDKLYTE